MANPTCGDIITDAYEELGVRGLGDTPSAEEMARGLTRLQNLWNSAVETGLFGRVEEYVATAAYEAEEGQRVYSAGFTITLPTTIQDEFTGYDRRPLDFAMIQVVNSGSDPQISLYDAHEAAWTRIDNLTQAGACPFGRRYRVGLVSALAQRLSPAFQVSPDAVSASAALMKTALSFRMSAPRVTTAANYF